MRENFFTCKHCDTVLSEEAEELEWNDEKNKIEGFQN